MSSLSVPSFGCLLAWFGLVWPSLVILCIRARAGEEDPVRQWSQESAKLPQAEVHFEHTRSLSGSSLVRDKIRQGKKNISEEEGEVTIIFIEIDQFEVLLKNYSPQELLNQLDQVYNAFDQFCDQFGLLKIETVGNSYMACGGLKSAEKKIDSRLLNRHHSVRVTDFAVEISSYVS